MFFVLAVWIRDAPRMVPIEAEGREGVTGVFHAHTQSSHDASLPMGVVTQAAADANLDFLVLTDHDIQPPPEDTNGVTVFSYSELSTGKGHVVQLGAQALLSEEDRTSEDVLLRIQEQGGFAVVTHPTAIRRPWSRTWEGAGGLEIASIYSSIYRVGGKTMLPILPVVAAFFIDSDLALAQLIDRDDEALAMWDANPDPLVGFCGLDTHGKLDVGKEMEGWQLAVDISVASTWPSKTEVASSEALLQALTRGQFYCAAGFLGVPRFLFLAQNSAGGTLGGMGSVVSGEEEYRLMAVIEYEGQPYTMRLYRDGEEILATQGKGLTLTTSTPGRYRIEVETELPGLLWGSRTVPVLYSNRIEIR